MYLSIFAAACSKNWMRIQSVAYQNVRWKKEKKKKGTHVWNNTPLCPNRKLVLKWATLQWPTIFFPVLFETRIFHKKKILFHSYTWFVFYQDLSSVSPSSRSTSLCDDRTDFKESGYFLLRSFSKIFGDEKAFTNFFFLRILLFTIQEIRLEPTR